MITKNLNLDKQAVKAQKALLLPIKNVTAFLRKKLSGHYKSLKIINFKNLSDMQNVRLQSKFPGTCCITSKIGDRELELSIKFNWKKWDTNHTNHTKNLIEYKTKERRGEIPIKVLENEAFIEQLKKWLKTGERIPWGKYESK